MENVLPTNRPTRRESINVNRIQFNGIFTDSAVAKGDEIAKSLATLKEDIAPACDKTFVMMKNKQVWFDRNNAALYPKFEHFNLPQFKTQGQPSRNYSVDFEGFHFVGMTRGEGLKSFTNSSGNPYKQPDGNFKNFPNSQNRFNLVLTGDCEPDGVYFINAEGVGKWNDSDIVTLVPIHRLRGKDAAAMNYNDAFITWIQLGLIPEDLKPKQEKLFKNFISDYSKLEEYVSFDNGNINFNSESFKSDVLSGKFKEKVFDYNFDISGTLEGVMSGQSQYTGSVNALKNELLNCDYKRANIQPYEERQITDINKGHWELFEDTATDTVQVQLPQDEILVARPPQLDVRCNGICAIDFGTKSTVVVCRDGEARMLRIGQGDYSKIPTMKDFENPTVIELRDLKNFLAAYKERIGRPFTEWNQVTVSHQAAEAIFKDSVGSSVYNSVFNELKQWAKDEQSYPVLKDLSGTIQEIKPYLETKAMDEDDFDPIELYAYYLGLYINNMHRQIYLDYILSFPVNYKKDVREKIRKSFENGIKKSLPPALLNDEEYMKNFRVYLGASEPAAYAISALEEYGLEPKAIGEKVAYGVFDFGGGTTDFDFGVEYIPENRRRNFIIEQFGFNGDVLLGGENILELIAYEVYKENLPEMRNKKIPFALPAGCEIFAGAETLVSRTKDANSHMNNRILAEKLRPIWENQADADIKKLTDDALSVTLFSNSKDNESGAFTVSVNLKIDENKLNKIIEDRIREGVVNFFQSLKSAFKNREIYPIHIFLAGNSCRSPIVKKLFDEFIKAETDNLASSVEKTVPPTENTAEKFILHMPLGMEGEAISADQNYFDLDKQRTGKTGVAFGLLRCRRGGKDIKIVNKNVDSGGEIIFPYFLGDAGNDGKTFTVRIGRDVDYNRWVYFTYADESEFELYYTTAPRALKNEMPVTQVSMIHCFIDEDDLTDDGDFGIYIRKISPDEIEYAVGCEKDFAGKFEGKIYRQRL